MLLQVLRAFKVPCEAGRLKDAYRVAVRMYHPDSNSKDKVGAGWSSGCGPGTEAPQGIEALRLEKAVFSSIFTAWPPPLP